MWGSVCCIFELVCEREGEEVCEEGHVHVGRRHRCEGEPVCAWGHVRKGERVQHEGCVCMCWRLDMSAGMSVTEEDNKGAPEGWWEWETVSVWAREGAVSTCRRKWRACVSNGEGKVRDVRALLRVWLPWPWPWAQCQRWGLALGPRWGALTEQKMPQFSSWSHKRQITMSPGRKVEEEAQMCVCALHLSTAKPLGIYLSLSVSGSARLCLCAHCGLVSMPVFVSICIWAFVSVCGCWSTPVCRTVSGFVCV